MTEPLSQQEIQDLRKRREQVKAMYAARNQLFTRYEDIYFMRNIEKPKDAGVDPNDWKVTASPGGRDKVTGMKRILDTSEIHIKVKDKDGDVVHNSDKIEAGLKQILTVSGEYRPARVERDTNLAAILYGPVVMTVNSLKDMISVKGKGTDASGKFILRQLEAIRKKTPFLIDTINPKESYPEWGPYGMIGHLQEYTLTGAEIRAQWDVTDKLDDAANYTVQDFFRYDKRLVEANGITLFSGVWLVDENGVPCLPVFVRYAGGSTLFHKPEEQLQSFLYSYAKGEWDRRENLFWTYLFTAIYTQGLPGPTIIRDPDDTSEIDIDYRGGVKIIKAKGTLQNIQVIDGDVLQLKALMDEQSGKSTVQEQTIGGNAGAATFSSYVMSVNAGKLPAIDPTEAQKQCYRDLFLHILYRIKYEGIANELISPDDIPDDCELEVAMEPDLQQDDLRNAQIVTQLKASGANVSDEWLNTNLLKIADSDAMFRQKTKEEIRKAIVANIMQDKNLMSQFIQAAMGQGQQPAEQQPTEQVPPGYHRMPDGSIMSDAEMQGQADMGQGQLPGMMPGAGAEAMPQTDAMIPMQERQ